MPPGVPPAAPLPRRPPRRRSGTVVRAPCYLSTMATKRDDGEEPAIDLARRAAEPGDAAALGAPPFSLEVIPADLMVLTRGERIVAALRVERSRAGLHVPLLIVAEEIRRRGVASRLLRELIDEAIRCGVPLSVEGPPSGPATRLLVGLGFVPAPTRAARRARFVFSL